MASRPIRTYGRRQLSAASSPLPSLPSLVDAPSSSGTLLFTPPSSPRAMSRGKGKVLADASSDMEDAPPSSPTLARKRQRDSPKEKKRPLGPSDANRPEKQGTLKGFFAPIKRARVDPRPSSKSSAPPAPEATPSRPSAAPTPASKTRLHQLQFMSNAMQTCTECGMSYLRGTDDADHARHHARVTRGIPWTGRKEARVLHDGVPLSWRDAGPNKFAARRSGTLPLLSTSSRTAAREYRVLALDASTSGRLIFDILYTVDTVLSAPALPPDMLARCKLFLAVTACEPPATPGAKRRPGPKPKEGGTERVVGVVVAQPIKWAMRVLRDTAADAEGGQVVDSGDGVMCDPKSLPTPLGIHRLFTVPAYRGCGLATALLDAAAAETVYGCTFDPTKGEVAFSQPTQSGRRMMEKWGRGAVRVFVEDHTQL